MGWVEFASQPMDWAKFASLWWLWLCITFVVIPILVFILDLINGRDLPGPAFLMGLMIQTIAWPLFFGAFILSVILNVLSFLRSVL